MPPLANPNIVYHNPELTDWACAIGTRHFPKKRKGKIIAVDIGWQEDKFVASENETAT